MTPPAPPLDDGGLPVEQRAKNLLVSAWRTQLSTLALAPGNSKQPHRPAVHGSLAPFAWRADGAVVFLAEEDSHVANVAANPLASLTVGHTDPPALAALLRSAVSSALPRCSLLGSLERVRAGDADYVRRLAGRAHAAARGEVGGAAAATAALEPLHPFLLTVHDARWVDCRGGHHPTSAEQVAAALADPFAAGGAPRLSRLNAGPGASERYARLCKAHLGVHIAEVVVAAVDRTGVTLLGRAEAAAPFREFRFAFSSEVRDDEALEAAVADMLAEADAHLALEHEAC